MVLNVSPQLVLAVEAPRAALVRTREPPRGLVSAAVLGQVGRLAEALAADVAREGLLACVGALVHGYGRVNTARLLDGAGGESGKLTQGTVLSEGAFAAGKVAGQGLLAAVDA